MTTMSKTTKSQKKLGSYTKIVPHLSGLEQLIYHKLLNAWCKYSKLAGISEFQHQHYSTKMQLCHWNCVGLVDEHDRFKSHDALQTARELLEEYLLFLAIKDPEGEDYAGTAQLLEDILQVEQRFFNAEAA